MSTTKLNKNIKVTEDAHRKLTRAKLEMFGTDSIHKVRFSEVVETLAEKEISGGYTDE